MTGSVHDLQYGNEAAREQACQRSPELAHDPVEGLASAVGNRAFASVATGGPGVLPGGREHPSVEQAIARMRGSGSPLDTGTKERVGTALGDSFDDVRVHTDPSADALAKSVSARAFATGSDVFFAVASALRGSGGAVSESGRLRQGAGGHPER
jgi:Domain of unknown function (DUF4157)